ncbi:MAG: methylmalonyl-CoA carboxyltransferase, partial [Elusimicrobiaceae bacterium]|nr:methylmalonyl-CoA carboxyltransferase [Elusimicrobiaceae bacterium]
MKDTEKFDLNDKELKETPEKIKKFRALIENTTKQDKEKAKLQNEKGKFTARERLQYLLDENSFFEIHS